MKNELNSEHVYPSGETPDGDHSGILSLVRKFNMQKLRLHYWFR